MQNKATTAIIYLHKAMCGLVCLSVGNAFCLYIVPPCFSYKCVYDVSPYLSYKLVRYGPFEIQAAAGGFLPITRFLFYKNNF